MTDPSGHGADAKRPSKQRSKSRVVLWGLLAAVTVAGLALVAFEASSPLKQAWSALTGDHGAKRWHSLTASNPTPCYATFSAYPPSQAGTCFHPEDAAIPRTPDDWNEPHLSVYSVRPVPRSSPTLRDLGDRGQKEAIRFLEDNAALKSKAWIDLQDALNYSANSDAGEKDPFRFDRVLVATVAKGLGWNPGDRMMWTRLFIQPINFTFAGYSVAATDNETVKIASLESTSSRKFSADLSATIPGMEAPKASASAGGEQNVKTTTDVNAQYEKLGIDITRGFLRIIRESETGGDVVGNTTVTLTAVTDAETIWRQFPADKCDPTAKIPRLSIKDRCHHGALPQIDGAEASDSKDLKAKDEDLVLLVTGIHPGDENPSPAGDGQSTPPQKPEVHSAIDVLPMVPVPHCALKARVWMLFAKREVEGGTNISYDESRQDVKLIRDAEDKADVEVMSADEVSPDVWSLKICDTTQCDKESLKPLQAMVKESGANGKKVAGVMRNVVFADYGKAVATAHWLRRAQQATPDGSNYTFNYPSSTPDSKEALVPVKNARDECKAVPKKSDDTVAKGG